MVEYQANKHREVNPKGPWVFLAVFLSVFFLLSAVLYIIDFVPEKPKSDTSEQPRVETANANTASTTRQTVVEEPVRIAIPSVRIDTPVVNPTSTDTKTLDDALLSGVARYPDSGLLGSNTGMYIFGHQSRLPIVQNKAFKAFAGLQDVKVGEEIIVYSGVARYQYRVLTVKHASAEDAWIEFSPGDTTLTLSTCDSFGKKTDRYVVTAEFVSKESII